MRRSNDWRELYDSELSVHVGAVLEAYIGPGWRNINGYERLGRVVGGTLLVLGYVFLALLWIALVVGMVYGFVVEPIQFLLELLKR